MFFHIRLLKHAIKQRKRYLWLILIPPAIFLIVQAFIPHKYHMTQELVVEEGVRFALGQNPLDTVSMETLLERPEMLFTESLALMDLRNQLLTREAAYRPEWSEWLPSKFAVFLQRVIYNELSLSLKQDVGISLEYSGPDRKIGAALIRFYSQRIIASAQRVPERSLVHGSVDTQVIFEVENASGRVFAESPMQISSSRTLYTHERSGKAIWILAVSALVITTSLCFMEYARPRVYTARQASRDLNVRVLGNIPDLGRLKFH